MAEATIENDARGLPADLVAAVAAIAAGSSGTRKPDALSTGLAAVDAALPPGGLLMGAVHELTGAAALGFAVRMLARLEGPVLWCAPAGERLRLYGPGLARAGLAAERLTIAAGADAKQVLWAAEEGLKSGAVAAVAVECPAPVGLTAGRRLQLAAEAGGALGLLLTGSGLAGGSGTAAGKAVPPGAAVTRWRVEPAPFPIPSPDPSVPAVLASWDLHLQRSRGGGEGRWTVHLDEAGGLRADAAPDPVSLAA